MRDFLATSRKTMGRVLRVGLLPALFPDVATLHVHLDHDNCLEIVALRGKPKQLRQIADHLIGMKGVKHGKVVLSSSNP